MDRLSFIPYKWLYSSLFPHSSYIHPFFLFYHLLYLPLKMSWENMPCLVAEQLCQCPTCLYKRCPNGLCTSVIFYYFHLCSANMKKKKNPEISVKSLSQSRMHNCCQAAFLSRFICEYLGEIMLLCDLIFIFSETSFS